MHLSKFIATVYAIVNLSPRYTIKHQLQDSRQCYSKLFLCSIFMTPVFKIMHVRQSCSVISSRHRARNGKLNCRQPGSRVDVFNTMPYCYSGTNKKELMVASIGVCDTPFSLYVPLYYLNRVP